MLPWKKGYVNKKKCIFYSTRLLKGWLMTEARQPQTLKSLQMIVHYQCAAVISKVCFANLHGLILLSISKLKRSQNPELFVRVVGVHLYTLSLPYCSAMGLPVPAVTTAETWTRKKAVLSTVKKGVNIICRSYLSSRKWCVAPPNVSTCECVRFCNGSGHNSRKISVRRFKSLILQGASLAHPPFSGA